MISKLSQILNDQKEKKKLENTTNLFRIQFKSLSGWEEKKKGGGGLSMHLIHQYHKGVTQYIAIQQGVVRGGLIISRGGWYSPPTHPSNWSKG